MISAQLLSTARVVILADLLLKFRDALTAPKTKTSAPDWHMAVVQA